MRSDSRFDRSRQVDISAYDPIWMKGFDWHFGVTEIHRNDRDAGGSRCAYVGAGIAHHDRVPRIAVCAPDRAEQDFRIRLHDLESVLAADAGKVSAKIGCFEKLCGEPLDLVRADGEAVASCCQVIQRLFKLWVRT